MPSDLTRAFLEKVARGSGWSLSEVESLCLEREGITQLGRDAFVGVERLMYLRLSHNHLSSLQGIEHLTSLVNGIFDSNRITSFREVDRLTRLPNLRDLDLRLNPIMALPPPRPSSTRTGSKESSNRSRDLVLEILPGLLRLDGLAVTDKERAKAISSMARPDRDAGTGRRAGGQNLRSHVRTRPAQIEDGRSAFAELTSSGYSSTRRGESGGLRRAPDRGEEVIEISKTHTGTRESGRFPRPIPARSRRISLRDGAARDDDDFTRSFVDGRVAEEIQAEPTVFSTNRKIPNDVAPNDSYRAGCEYQAAAAGGAVVAGKEHPLRGKPSFILERKQHRQETAFGGDGGVKASDNFESSVALSGGGGSGDGTVVRNRAGVCCSSRSGAHCEAELKPPPVYLSSGDAAGNGDDIGRSYKSNNKRDRSGEQAHELPLREEQVVVVGGANGRGVKRDEGKESHDNGRHRRCPRRYREQQRYHPGAQAGAEMFRAIADSNGVAGSGGGDSNRSKYENRERSTRKDDTSSLPSYHTEEPAGRQNDGNNGCWLIASGCNEDGEDDDLATLWAELNATSGTLSNLRLQEQASSANTPGRVPAIGDVRHGGSQVPSWRGLSFNDGDAGRYAVHPCPPSPPYSHVSSNKQSARLLVSELRAPCAAPRSPRATARSCRLASAIVQRSHERRANEPRDELRQERCGMRGGDSGSTHVFTLNAAQQSSQPKMPVNLTSSRLTAGSMTPATDSQHHGGTVVSMTPAASPPIPIPEDAPRAYSSLQAAPATAVSSSPSSSKSNASAAARAVEAFRRSSQRLGLVDSERTLSCVAPDDGRGHAVAPIVTAGHRDCGGNGDDAGCGSNVNQSRAASRLSVSDCTDGERRANAATAATAVTAGGERGQVTAVVDAVAPPDSPTSSLSPRDDELACTAQSANGKGRIAGDATTTLPAKATAAASGTENSASIATVSSPTSSSYVAATADAVVVSLGSSRYHSEAVSNLPADKSRRSIVHANKWKQCKTCGGLVKTDRSGPGTEGSASARTAAANTGVLAGLESDLLEEKWWAREKEFEEKWSSREREFDARWAAREREFDKRRREDAKEFALGVRAMLFEAHEALIASNAWLVSRLRAAEGSHPPSVAHNSDNLSVVRRNEGSRIQDLGDLSIESDPSHRTDGSNHGRRRGVQPTLPSPTTPAQAAHGRGTRELAEANPAALGLACDFLADADMELAGGHAGSAPGITPSAGNVETRQRGQGKGGNRHAEAGGEQSTPITSAGEMDPQDTRDARKHIPSIASAMSMDCDSWDSRKYPPSRHATVATEEQKPPPLVRNSDRANGAVLVYASSSSSATEFRGNKAVISGGDALSPCLTILPLGQELEAATDDGMGTAGGEAAVSQTTSAAGNTATVVRSSEPPRVVDSVVSVPNNTKSLQDDHNRSVHGLVSDGANDLGQKSSGRAVAGRVGEGGSSGASVVVDDGNANAASEHADDVNLGNNDTEAATASSHYGSSRKGFDSRNVVIHTADGQDIRGDYSDGDGPEQDVDSSVGGGGPASGIQVADNDRNRHGDRDATSTVGPGKMLEAQAGASLRGGGGGDDSGDCFADPEITVSTPERC